MPKLKNETATAEAVGRKLRLMRKQSKKTLHETAKKLDISIVAYSKIEHGKSTLTLPRLEQLARTFNTTLGDLLDLPPTDAQLKNEILEEKLRERDAMVRLLQNQNTRLQKMLANTKKRQINKKGKNEDRH